jgi:hypothetical protein
METYVRVTTLEDFERFGSIVNKLDKTKILVFSKIDRNVSNAKTSILENIGIKNDRKLLEQIEIDFELMNIRLRGTDRTGAVKENVNREELKNDSVHASVIKKFKKIILSLEDLKKIINKITKSSYFFSHSDHADSNKKKILEQIKTLQRRMIKYETSSQRKRVESAMKISKNFKIIQTKMLTDCFACFTFIRQNYTYNFNSKNKNNCSLLTYHGNTLGANCQFVGFFGDNADKIVFKDFINGKFKPIFVFYETTGGYTKIDDLNYNDNYLNTGEYFLRLEHGEEKKTKVYKDNTSEVYIERHASLLDEYVLVSNLDKEIYTMTMSDSCKKITVDDNIDVSTSAIILDYLKLVNKEETEYSTADSSDITTESTTDDMTDDVTDDTLKKKYLKYKTKYLELKFKNTKFF